MCVFGEKGVGSESYFIPNDPYEFCSEGSNGIEMCAGSTAAAGWWVAAAVQVACKVTSDEFADGRAEYAVDMSMGVTGNSKKLSVSKKVASGYSGVE